MADHADAPRHGAGHRPSPGAARRAAARRPDVADGGARGRHAAHHLPDRPARRRRRARARRDCRAAGAERRPRARLPGAAAHARGAGARETRREARLAGDAAAASLDERRGSPPPVDPLAAERQRREYESLFASNVVLSRRPEAERPDAAASAPRRDVATAPAGTAEPSIDEIADAVVRATHAARCRRGARDASDLVAERRRVAGADRVTASAATPAATGPISAVGPAASRARGHA